MAAGKAGKAGAGGSASAGPSSAATTNTTATNTPHKGKGTGRGRGRPRKNPLPEAVDKNAASTSEPPTPGTSKAAATQDVPMDTTADASVNAAPVTEAQTADPPRKRGRPRKTQIEVENTQKGGEDAINRGAEQEGGDGDESEYQDDEEADDADVERMMTDGKAQPAKDKGKQKATKAADQVGSSSKPKRKRAPAKSAAPEPEEVEVTRRPPQLTVHSGISIDKRAVPTKFASKIGQRVALKQTPWPYDGRGEVVPHQASDDLIVEMKRRARKWKDEVYRFPPDLLSDFHWFPGKVCHGKQVYSVVGGSTWADMQVDYGPTSCKLLSSNTVDTRRRKALEMAEERAVAMAIDDTEDEEYRIKTEEDMDVDQEDNEEAAGGAGPSNASVAPTKTAALPIFSEEGALQLQFGAEGVRQDTTIPPELSLQATNLDPLRGVSFFNTGGHNYCVECAPTGMNATGKEYFAVSVSFEQRPDTPYGVRVPRGTPGMIQFWSVNPAQGAPAANQAQRPSPSVSLEMVLHVDLGAASQIQWCPVNLDNGVKMPKWKTVDTLGILAGTFRTGGMGIFTIPHPDQLKAIRKIRSNQPLHISMEPGLYLDPLETSVECLDWCTPSRIAAGCANGKVAVWDLEAAVEDGPTQQTEIQPTFYSKVVDSCITAVRWIMYPPTDPIGQIQWSGLPHMINVTALNGGDAFVDLREAHTAHQIRIGNLGYGTPAFDAAYSHHDVGVVVEQTSYSVVVHHCIVPFYGRSTRVGWANAPTLGLATSVYHPLYAGAAGDGTVRVCNVWRNLTIRMARIEHILYRLVWDPERGTMRMLEHYLPNQVIGRDAAGASFDWPIETAATDVSWSKHINRAYLLVSTFACGLGRVDWLGA